MQRGIFSSRFSLSLGRTSVRTASLRAGGPGPAAGGECCCLGWPVWSSAVCCEGNDRICRQCSQRSMDMEKGELNREVGNRPATPTSRRPCDHQTSKRNPVQTRTANVAGQTSNKILVPTGCFTNHCAAAPRHRSCCASHADDVRPTDQFRITSDQRSTK